MIDRPAGAAGFAGFGNQRAAGYAADDAVAAGKVGGIGPRAQGKLADYGAPFGQDSLRQAPVFPGVHRIQSVAQHGNRPAAGIDRGPVGGGVNPHGQAADHHHAAPGQGGAQVGGNAASVVGGPPGADHRQGCLIRVRAQDAAGVQHRRRIGRLFQATGVLGIVPGKSRDAGFRQSFQLVVRVDRFPGGDDGLRYPAPHAGGAQLPRGGAPRLP